MHRGTFATIVDRKELRYPTTELNRGRQGWVKLNYVVTTEGKVIDPVIEDSSGSRNFERAAIRYIQNMRYKPATWDGYPVEQCHTEMTFSFAIEPTPIGASRRFIRRYRSINEEIDNENLEKANEDIDEAFDKWDLTVYELARLWMLRGQLALKKNDPEMQLASFRKATVNDGLWIEDDLYQSLLINIITLELRTGQYSSALRNYEKLVELGATPEELNSLPSIIQSVRDQVEGVTPIATPAKLVAERQCDDCSADWQYRPLRRKFTIADVQGSLEQIEFRCDWRRLVDVAREGVNWTLPEEWGKCRIVVFGDDGTTFKLVEFQTST